MNKLTQSSTGRPVSRAGPLSTPGQAPTSGTDTYQRSISKLFDTNESRGGSKARSRSEGSKTCGAAGSGTVSSRGGSRDSCTVDDSEAAEEGALKTAEEDNLPKSECPFDARGECPLEGGAAGTDVDPHEYLHAVAR